MTKLHRRSRCRRCAPSCDAEALESRSLLNVAIAPPGFSPAGAVVQANTFNVWSQMTTVETPQCVATDADGDFVVVWTDDYAEDLRKGVFGQRFDKLGRRVGGQIHVNTTTQSNQDQPAVAMDADGDFVVAWHDESAGESIVARRFNADGTPRGGEFLVNHDPSNSHSRPSVAMDAQGDFVIAWTVYGAYAVVARRYAADGTAGAVFNVNAVRRGYQGSVRVAMNPSGEFVAAWTAPSDDYQKSVMARRFDATGTPRGGDVVVASHVGSSFAGTLDFVPSPTIDASGRSVIAWQQLPAGDGSRVAAFARRLDAAGAPVGDAMQASTSQSFVDGYSEPVVAADAAGAFVVSWAGKPDDNTNPSVYGRRFDASGAAQGDVFRVSEVTSDRHPSIAAEPNGDFVVVYSGTGPATNGLETFVQRYAAGPTVSTDLEPAAPPPRTTPVERVVVRFNTPVTGFELSDLALTRNGGPNLLPGAAALGSTDGGLTYTLEGLAPLTATAGDYALSLAGPGPGITDSGGRELANAVGAAWRTNGVAGRHVFYNASALDGNEPGADVRDDAAIATDKVALLRGDAPSASNATSYARGLNGIMLDMLGLPDRGANLRADDFAFRTAGHDAPAPASISVRRGAGVGGSDRVTITWADGNAVKNGWLRVTVKGNSRTGLSADDVFSFGNLIGDANGDFRVNALDLAAVKRALNTTPDVTSRYDFNRDGRINALDVAVLKQNLGRLLSPPGDDELLGGDATS